MYHDNIIIHIAGEMLSVAEPFLEQKMHPTTIITAYRQALDDIISITRDKIRYMEICVLYGPSLVRLSSTCTWT